MRRFCLSSAASVASRATRCRCMDSENIYALERKRFVFYPTWRDRGQGDLVICRAVIPTVKPSPVGQSLSGSRR